MKIWQILNMFEDRQQIAIVEVEIDDDGAYEKWNFMENTFNYLIPEKYKDETVYFMEIHDETLYIEYRI